MPATSDSTSTYSITGESFVTFDPPSQGGVVARRRAVVVCMPRTFLVLNVLRPLTANGPVAAPVLQ